MGVYGKECRVENPSLPELPELFRTLDPARIRQLILAFEAELAAMPENLGKDPFPLVHTFADGCYIREIRIPQGGLYVGSIHKHAHPRFLLEGELLVVTEAGGRQHCIAPSYMVTPAGTKRVGLALEDTVIVTVHVTNETDLDAIETALIAPDYAALEAYQARHKETLP